MDSMNRTEEINAQIFVGEMMRIVLNNPEQVEKKIHDLLKVDQLLNVIEVIFKNFETNKLPVNNIRIKEKIAVLVQANLRLGNIETENEFRKKGWVVL